jgi:hypothetical protein
MRDKILTVLLVVVSIVVSDLILAQVARRTVGPWKNEILEREARIETPPYHHGLAPYASFINYFGDWHAPYFTNSLGFRDASPRKVELKSAKPRLLLIGDSITEGNGLPWEQTFAGILAKDMEKRGVELLNAAVQTYAYRIYYKKIRHFIETVGLDVDEVVAFIDLGDVINASFHYRLDDKGNVVGRLGKHEYSSVKKFKLMLRDNSILYRLYRYWRDTSKEIRRRHGKGSFEAATNVFGLTWTFNDKEYEEWAKPGEPVAREFMGRLKDFLAARGIPLTIVLYPVPDQIRQRDLDSRHVRFWRAWAAEKDVQVVNLFPLFINDRPAKEVYEENFVPYNYHFGPKGHVNIARAFLERWQPSPRLAATAAK